VNTVGLPGSLAEFGPAALSAVVVAGYLVVGEPLEIPVGGQPGAETVRARLARMVQQLDQLRSTA